MNVPFVYLSLQFADIRSEIEEALVKTAGEFRYILGPRVAAFEKEFADFCQSKHCLGVGNGLDALVLALRACGVGPGDEVILPAHTFFATALAVHAVGATIVLCDVNPDTHSIDLSALRNAMTPKTKAVIPVHLYGNPAPMLEIMDLAHDGGFFVIEDNAQAQGAKIGNRLTGSIGHLAATSFYPTKNLGAMGDGGAVTTNDADLASLISKMRNYGQKKKYEHEIPGVNSRLDEIQAAVLSVKLKRLSVWNQKRREIAKAYRERLRDCSEINMPSETVSKNEKAESVFHLFTLQTEKRDELAESLESKGIASLIHYPRAIHQHLAMKQIPFRQVSDLKVSETICRTTLSLPLFAEMKPEQVEFVCDQVFNHFRNSR